MTHGVESRITFAGPVYGASKAALIEMASVLVLPSYSENFGNVVLEAWARGCPVILTPEVGLADTVAESGAGWVAKGTPEAIGRAIEDAVSNAAASRRRGELGRIEVARRFTWDAVAAQMEQVYTRAGASIS
jgi:glycosyltransferase involved in cell wall biosynthesis